MEDFICAFKNFKFKLKTKFIPVLKSSSSTGALVFSVRTKSVEFGQVRLRPLNRSRSPSATPGSK